MMNRKILGIVFSNMHDNTMGSLTMERTMASIPYGGRYRLIDFTLSSLVNSGIHDVGIIAKNNYQSLMDHLGSGKEWDLSRKNGGLCVLPPYSRSGSGVYKGRLEALSGILHYIKSFKGDYVVMTDCDTVAVVDYQKMLQFHEAKNADITVFYKSKDITKEQRNNTTLLQMDEDGRVRDVLMDTGDKRGNAFLDKILIRKDLLERIVMDAASHNKVSFTREVLQNQKDTLRIFGYEFNGYLADIKSVAAYYHCSMELLNPTVRAELFQPLRPVYTRVRDEVPVKYGIKAVAKNSMIADGCVIQGTVENSIIFRGVKISKGAVVKNSIIMQGAIVGENANLDCVILDRNVILRDGRTLIGCESYPICIEKGAVI